jgi:hypothetical protein
MHFAASCSWLHPQEEGCLPPQDAVGCRSYPSCRHCHRCSCQHHLGPADFHVWKGDDCSPRCTQLRCRALHFWCTLLAHYVLLTSRFFLLAELLIPGPGCEHTQASGQAGQRSSSAGELRIFNVFSFFYIFTNSFH